MVGASERLEGVSGGLALKGTLKRPGMEPSSATMFNSFEVLVDFTPETNERRAAGSRGPMSATTTLCLLKVIAGSANAAQRRDTCPAMACDQAMPSYFSGYSPRRIQASGTTAFSPPCKSFAAEHRKLLGSILHGARRHGLIRIFRGNGQRLTASISAPGTRHAPPHPPCD